MPKAFPFRLAVLPFLALPAIAAGPSCWLRDLASPVNNLAIAMCAQGTMWITTDGGGTWAAQDSKATKTLRALAFLDAKRGLAAGDGGLILATADGGKTWKENPSGTTENLLDLGFTGEQGWAVGFNGAIIHSKDGGATWEKQKSGTSQTLENIFFLDAHHGWTVGWAGTILATTDGGATWTPLKADAATWSLSSIFFKDLQTGWVVGFAGQIVRTTDGGKTWTAQPSPVHGWLTSIAFDKYGHGWITHDDGFLTSEDGGQTWKPVATQSRYFLSKLFRVGDSLWAVGQSAIMRQASDGKSWARIQSLVLDRSSTQ